jgi:hypothetical protein
MERTFKSKTNKSPKFLNLFSVAADYNTPIGFKPGTHGNKGITKWRISSPERSNTRNPLQERAYKK